MGGAGGQSVNLKQPRIIKMTMQIPIFFGSPFLFLPRSQHLIGTRMYANRSYTPFEKAYGTYCHCLRQHFPVAVAMIMIPMSMAMAMSSSTAL